MYLCSSNIGRTEEKWILNVVKLRELLHVTLFVSHKCFYFVATFSAAKKKVVFHGAFHDFAIHHGSKNRVRNSQEKDEGE